MTEMIKKWRSLGVVIIVLAAVVALGTFGGDQLWRNVYAEGRAAVAPAGGSGAQPGTIVTPGTETGTVVPSALSGTGSSGQVTFWTGTESLSGDNDFYWDNTNKRLGIGTASPSRKLHYYGDAALFQRDVDAAGFIIQRTDTNRWVFGASENPSLGTGFSIYTYPVGAGSATSRLFLDLDGRVGIGTTSPYTYTKLHVVTTESSNDAVYGENTGSSTYGSLGSWTYGVYGEDSSAEGTGKGVYGKNSANDNFGFLGGITYGVYGQVETGAADKGVYGFHNTSKNFGFLGETNYGAYGKNETSDNYGYLGSNSYGAYGKHEVSDNFGYLGSSSYGVYGSSGSGSGVSGDSGSGSGVFGNSSTGQGVWGASEEGPGVYGQSTSNYGVYGINYDNLNYGYLAGNDYGAYGENDSDDIYGYLGGANYGAYGRYGYTGPYGYLGSSTYGVFGTSDSGDGVHGESGSGAGVYGYSATGAAGHFEGNVRITGTLTVGSEPGVSMGRIYLAADGEIISTDGGTRVLYWDETNGEIEITNTSGDYCDYWWQAQKGAETTGGSGTINTGLSNQVIISGTGTSGYGFEVHFGQADGTEGWCSVWLQCANDKLVGHYIKY